MKTSLLLAILILVVIVAFLAWLVYQYNKYDSFVSRPQPDGKNEGGVEEEKAVQEHPGNLSLWVYTSVNFLAVAVYTIIMTMGAITVLVVASVLVIYTVQSIDGKIDQIFFKLENGYWKHNLSERYSDSTNMTRFWEEFDNRPAKFDFIVPKGDPGSSVTVTGSPIQGFGSSLEQAFDDQ